MFTLTLAGAAALAAATPMLSSEAAQGQPINLTPANMFILADTAARNDDLPTAEAVYRALATNPKIEIRSEARFRLAMLFVSKKRLTEGAVLLRTILDEQPRAERVRLELASIMLAIGDESSARRELRAVRSGALPGEVAQMVDRFSAALRARKPFGGSVQIAIVSDSNINRATRSDTLGTIIGDFILNDDAKARSGRGLSTDGQVYARMPLGNHAFLTTLSGSAELYRKKEFDDITVAAKAGPELRLGSDRLNLSAGSRRRWYGGDKLSTAFGVEADFTHPFASIAQLRTSASAYRVTNHRNALETGWNLSSTLAGEMALSQRSGGGIAVTGIRQSLRDLGYSTTSGQVTLFGYRELGKLTLTASGSLSHLEADRRLFLYPQRRKEWLRRGTLGATFRQLTYAGFAPTAQLTIERNHSSIEIYDYRRTAFEVGVTRAF